MSGSAGRQRMRRRIGQWSRGRDPTGVGFCAVAIRQVLARATGSADTWVGALLPPLPLAGFAQCRIALGAGSNSLPSPSRFGPARTGPTIRGLNPAG